MPSQFFGLKIAESGLVSYQASDNTTAHNIANVDTEGITRQKAKLNTMQAIIINTKYGSMGAGVEVDKIEQLRNEYYDLKYWSNETKLGEMQTKQDYLSQIELNFVDDDKIKGFTTIFSDYFKAMDTMKTDAYSLTSRNAYIGQAKTLCEYFNSINEKLSDLQDEINNVIETRVADINGIAQKIANLNKQINIIEQQQGSAAELRDQRNLLVDQLAKIVPVEISERPIVNSNFPDVYTGATEYRVKIDGQLLVDNYDYNKLVCVARDLNHQVNESDVDGLFDIYWTVNPYTDEVSSRKLEVNSKTMGGELKALFAVRDGNNNQGFSGTIKDVPLDRSKYPLTVTIFDPSITDPKKASMPEHGTIRLGNKNFRYESYTLNEIVDKNTGESTYEYVFEIRYEEDGSPISLDDLRGLTGKESTIGESIDYMGIAYYQQQINEFVRNFALEYNKISMTGVDESGEMSSAFFIADDLYNGGEYGYTDAAHVMKESVDENGNTVHSYKGSYYYTYLTAKNFTISAEAMKNAGSIATATPDAFMNGVDSYDIVDKLLELKDGVKMFRGGVAGEFLQCLLSDISVDTQKTKIFTNNYENLQEAILRQRQSVSSVDKDEEALDLVKFQNAYNLSSKMISVLQEMYNQLILNTGV